MSRSRPVTPRADSTTRRDVEEGDTELHDVPFLRNVNTAPRAVKFTAWRIINIGVLLGLGVPKAVAAYNVEQDCPECAAWLFAYDLRTVLGIGVTGLCGIIWAAFYISFSIEAGFTVERHLWLSGWSQFAVALSFTVAFMALLGLAPVLTYKLVLLVRRNVQMLLSGSPGSSFLLGFFKFQIEPCDPLTTRVSPD
ncbi:hypothetical protein C8J57DRAFT_1253161 [Mycena rebaudengoi]|nr:hypothetical protein C8J57DRAFT_1253161 [Mycena rebaudengoi]